MPESALQSAPALKEIFNHQRLRHIATEVAAVFPLFPAERFLTRASRDLDALGIMQRLRQVAVSLHESLPGGFAANAGTLRAVAPRINHGFASMVLPEYVALYGLDHGDAALDALKFLTRFGSSEFAVRHFLNRDLPGTLAVMEQWSLDDDDHVRRLASEGCRPRLPWSFQLRPLIADPSPTARILENLKRDPSAYVRKSVANHLNDIAKDHPGWVLEKLSGWPKDDRRTAWIVKHGLRTLIKNGDPQALTLIGASGKALVRVEEFRVTPDSFALGGSIRISARMVSTSPQPQRLVVDYAIHYVKKGGGTSRKVFKLKELTVEAFATCALAITQTVRDFTTRKHYPGHHRLELMVNGETLAESGFTLSG